VRFSVELVSGVRLALECRAALAALSLAAGRAVRLARAVLEERPAGDVFGFEVWVDQAPAAAAIDQALSALAAACWVGAREAALLTDPGAARAYLAMRPPSARPFVSSLPPIGSLSFEEVHHEGVVR
jgi:hypothetical protein